MSASSMSYELLRSVYDHVHRILWDRAVQVSVSYDTLEGALRRELGVRAVQQELDAVLDLLVEAGVLYRLTFEESDDRFWPVERGAPRVRPECVDYTTVVKKRDPHFNIERVLEALASKIHALDTQPIAQPPAVAPTRNTAMSKNEQEPLHSRIVNALASGALLIDAIIERIPDVNSKILKMQLGNLVKSRQLRVGVNADGVKVYWQALDSTPDGVRPIRPYKARVKTEKAEETEQETEALGSLTIDDDNADRANFQIDEHGDLVVAFDGNCVLIVSGQAAQRLYRFLNASCAYSIKQAALSVQENLVASK